MARPLRIQYSGAMYHVMNRGDQREDIFRDDEDRQRFLGTRTEACWGSYPDYLRKPEARPRWLRVDRLLGEKGIPKDSEAGREQFSKMREARRAEESTADYEHWRKDWVLGTEQFRQELLAAVTERIGPSHFGEQRQETAEQKAEGLLKAELEKLG